MCDPQSIAQVGLVLDTGAGLMGASAAYDRASIDRTVAQNNAQLADLQAKDAIARGGQAELTLRNKSAQLKGTQVARFASGNVQLQGSALDVLEQTDRMTELDAAVIRHNAQDEAWARRMEAMGYRARAANSDPAMAGFTSLLSSAGQVADRWYQYADRYGG